MKLLLKIALAFLAVIVIAVGYLNTGYFLTRQTWKYVHGAYWGDLLQLKGKAVYYDGKEMGRVKYYTGRVLVVVNLTTGELGYYRSI